MDGTMIFGAIVFAVIFMFIRVSSQREDQTTIVVNPNSHRYNDGAGSGLAWVGILLILFVVFLGFAQRT